MVELNVCELFPVWAYVIMANFAAHHC